MVRRLVPVFLSTVGIAIALPSARADWDRPSRESRPLEPHVGFLLAPQITHLTGTYDRDLLLGGRIGILYFSPGPGRAASEIDVLIDRKGGIRPDHFGGVPDPAFREPYAYRRTLRLTYLTIPLTIRYALNRGPTRLYLRAGPEVSALLLASAESAGGSTQDVSRDMNALDAGLFCGSGVEFPFGPVNAFIEAGATFGFGDVDNEGSQNRAFGLAFGVRSATPPPGSRLEPAGRDR